MTQVNDKVQKQTRLEQTTSCLFAFDGPFLLMCFFTSFFHFFFSFFFSFWFFLVLCFFFFLVVTTDVFVCFVGADNNNDDGEGVLGLIMRYVPQEVEFGGLGDFVLTEDIGNIGFVCTDESSCFGETRERDEGTDG